ncbi:MAG TPA: hypothetical protein VLZ50_14290 [Terracidiphilus sp.]|nr:hypothetical protein [Terracidiphilus sp.]
MAKDCRHIMPNGETCHSPALRDKPYCCFHTRLHRAPVQPRSPNEPLAIPVLEDRCAIQLALSQVLSALASGQLDPRRAALLLYGLQIASQNVERKGSVLPFFGATSVEISADGNELGPIRRD